MLLTPPLQISLFEMRGQDPAIGDGGDALTRARAISPATLPKDRARSSAAVARQAGKSRQCRSLAIVGRRAVSCDVRIDPLQQRRPIAAAPIVQVIAKKAAHGE